MWGPQGGSPGEGHGLRVFSFVPLEPRNWAEQQRKAGGDEGTQHVGGIRWALPARGLQAPVVLPLLA